MFESILFPFFDRYDVSNDHFIDFMELKLMMEALGAPQTHLGLKQMIKEVDEDNDGKISFREVSVVIRGGDRSVWPFYFYFFNFFQ